MTYTEFQMLTSEKQLTLRPLCPTVQFDLESHPLDSKFVKDKNISATQFKLKVKQVSFHNKKNMEINYLPHLIDKFKKHSKTETLVKCYILCATKEAVILHIMRLQSSLYRIKIIKVLYLIFIC